MAIWNQTLIDNLRFAVQHDAFWSQKIESVTSRSINPVSVHLAVLVEPYLQYILDGKKTVESRFSARRYAPYKQVESGDVLVLKRSSGPIVGLCEVADKWFYHLDPASWRYIREKFTQALCAHDQGFWRDREAASFATLMRIDHVLSIEPTECEKRDRRGWVVLRTRHEQMELEVH